jgi:1-deoxy-D-xylulose-5-phosphate reductoisomerase
VFNAANEQAVAAFHDGAIGFLDIVDTVERIVEEHTAGEPSLDGVLAAERWARTAADRALTR